MSAVAEPRLTVGIMASVVLHGAVIAAFVLLKPQPGPPPPPMIRVSMIAAPPGPRAIGVVQPQPTPAPPPPETPKPQPTMTAPTRTPVPAPKAKAAAPRQATPEAAPKSTDVKPPPDAPAAGGGATGGKGADVATIDTPGIEFDYPFYTTNIVRQLILAFGQMNGTLKAEVQFVIRRDGSVDPNGIRLATSSGNYSFDQRALAAVEAVANAKKFGALPGGFNEDILPVTFWFSPSVVR